MMTFNPQLITNDQGDPIFAVIPFHVYRELMARVASEAPPTSDNAEAPASRARDGASAVPGSSTHSASLDHANAGDRNLSVKELRPGTTPLEHRFGLREKGVKAWARYEEHALLIEKGSEAALDESESFKKSCVSASERRRELVERGVLVLTDGKYVFAVDVVCYSPTEAANIVCGNSRNGLDAWRNIDGRPLKEVLPDDAFIRGRRRRR